MRRLALALAATFASAAGGEPAWAATFTVDSVADLVALGNTTDRDCDANDLDPGADTCTLRAAVQEANGSAGGDTISLPDLGAEYLLVLGPVGEEQAAGGDLDVRGDLTIQGTGQPVVRSDGDDRVLHLGPASTAPSVTVNGIEVRGGGGVDRGAGVYADSGTLALSSSTIAGNTASSPAAGAQGGGVWLDPGSHQISQSTISANTVSGQTGAVGGGVAVASGALLTISSSTVSGNVASSAGGAAVGGGAYVQGAAALVQSTMAFNATLGAVASGGGSIQATGGSVTLRGSIISGGIADAGAENCGVSSATVATQGANLEAPSAAGASQCNLLSSFGDRFSSGAGLASLADRGGPTQTHALLNGSAALDAIPSCFPFVADQRGLPRPGGSACDIGSFERQVLAPPGAGCFGKKPTIVGTAQGETILGTPAPDVILGQAGKDVIKGRGGKDRICAGKGDDRAFGAASGDRLAGDDGDDRLFGQDGKDTLLGNAGRDFLDGGKSRDLLNGGGRADACRGAGDKLKDC